MNTPEGKAFDDREIYIDYLRELHGRLASVERDTGITRWAVIAGLIYIAWQSIPLVSQVIATQDLSAVFLTCAAFVGTVLVSSQLLYFSMSSAPGKTKFDYRFTVDAPDSGTHIFTGLLIFLWLGIPAILNTVSWHQNLRLSDFQFRVLSFNAWCFWGVGLVLSVAYVSIQISWFRTGFPPAKLAVPNSRRTDNFMTVLVAVIAVGLLLANASALIELFAAIQANSPKSYDPVVLALNFILALAGIRILVGTIPRSDALARLRQIERDAILHDLSPEQIKKRLEDAYLGRQIGSWLDEKLCEMREHCDQLNGVCEEFAELMRSLDSLQHDLLHERCGRLTEYRNKLTCLVKQNLQKSTTLTRWVESAVLFNAADDYTTRLLRSALNELKQGIPIREAALEVLLRVKNEMGQLKGAESS